MTAEELSVILQGPPDIAARALLGCRLVLEQDGHRLVGRIVETEAYDQTDAASHSYRGRTPRTDVMFGPAGHLYVYFTYGMHYCCNVVTGPEGHGSAVLVRAVEPLEGADIMSVNRKGRGGKGGLELTNGPAKLCQAFGIDAQWNGHDLSQPPLLLLPYERTLTGSGAIGGLGTRDIVQTTRIGISQATDVAWRFYIKDNPYVSRQ